MFSLMYAIITISIDIHLLRLAFTQSESSVISTLHQDQSSSQAIHTFNENEYFICSNLPCGLTLNKVDLYLMYGGTPTCVFKDKKFTIFVYDSNDINVHNISLTITGIFYFSIHSFYSYWENF